VADAAFVLQVMAGSDPNDPTTLREPVPDFSAGMKQGITRG
jgi:Asp-tRNA(Asn)/Glu-tRNA(Gln) amidotransferase A subunit family amidase